MPSTSAVHEQLTDILVRVVGCPADAVVPQAVLKELGTDSLTIVEVGEELGRRFGVYLSDDTIDGLVTVQDAIDAIVRHDGSQRPGDTTSPPPAPRPAPPADEVSPVTQPSSARRGRKTAFAIRFGFLGLVIGAVLGLGGAALVSATGLDDVDLPPISAPTSAPTTKATTPKPTPTRTTSTGVPKPTIQASSERVSPGERFILTGVFPGSDAGESLQVEVRDKGESWDDFPLNPETRDGGTFKTELYTTRSGPREFRVTNTTIGKSTPAVAIEIG